MTEKNLKPDVATLFACAREEGSLGAEAHAALTVVDIGAEIQAALGVSVDDVAASEVVLVSLMPDDSGSIRSAGNEAAIREGHNLVLDALSSSRQRDTILVHTRYLNGKILFPYCPLEQTVKMTAQNYQAEHGTPLYDQTVVLLGTVLAKTQEFTQNGVAVRSVTLLLSDGCDQHSQLADADAVCAIVQDMLRAESHVVAAMGVDDGQTDFRRVFRDMGIRDEWIMTPKNNAGEIRRAFQVFSQSAIRVSQGGAATGLFAPAKPTAH